MHKCGDTRNLMLVSSHLAGDVYSPCWPLLNQCHLWYEFIIPKLKVVTYRSCKDISAVKISVRQSQHARIYFRCDIWTQKFTTWGICQMHLNKTHQVFFRSAVKARCIDYFNYDCKETYRKHFSCTIPGWSSVRKLCWLQQDCHLGQIFTEN